LIDVIFVPKQKVKSDVCVLIDVLRATSVIVTALANGAVSVKPVSNVRKALAEKTSNMLVCGERKSVKPRGFDLGNSPTEYSRERVAGKRIVLTTSNGTRAVEKIECKILYAASFLNLSAVVQQLRRHRHFTLVCSGQNGGIAVEDVLCAGAIVAMCGAKEKSDSALIAESVWKCSDSVFRSLCESKHGQELIEIGFLKDIEYCSQIDIHPIVPVFDGTSFTLRKTAQSGQV